MSCLQPGFPPITTPSLGFPPITTPSFTLTLPLQSSSPDPNPTTTTINPSVDTFLKNILQAVTEDDHPICSSCLEDKIAISRCTDCSELLCEVCWRRHSRSHLTKEHRIVYFARPASSSTTSSSPQASSPPSFLLSSISNYCNRHQEPHRFYCELCLMELCTECTYLEHRGHMLNYMRNAVITTRTTSVRLSSESFTAIDILNEAINTIQTRCDGVEARSFKAAADVKNVMKRFFTAIDQREKELLSRIDQQRQIKGKALHIQLESLKFTLAKLKVSSDILDKSIEGRSNNMDLSLVNEKVGTELLQLRTIRNGLEPCEDDYITFVTPDLTLLRALATMGNINVTPFRPRVKESPPGNNFSLPVELKMTDCSNIVPGLSPRSRPVPGAVLPIITRDNGGEPSLIFCGEGEQDGQLCRPWGVCCDRDGHIIVADRSNNRIQIFNSNGSFARKFGTPGVTPGKFNRPAGVAVDPLNRIVVADKDNHRIQIFTTDGTFKFLFGEKGPRNGQFNYPWDVAVNSLGHIVVSDTRNHRIQLFTNEGMFINKYGFESSPIMWKHFDSPRGVCFTPSGNIIVTDFNNHRLVIIDANFTGAQFLGTEGLGFKQFLRPQGIVCDDEGRIIVADSRNNRIQVFESNGTFLWKMGKPGDGPGEFEIPSGVGLTPKGQVVVVDFGNNRIQVF